MPRPLDTRQRAAMLRYCPDSFPVEPRKGARRIDLDEAAKRGATMDRATYHAWFAEHVEHHYHPRNDGPNPYHVGERVQLLTGGHCGRGESDTWHDGIVTKVGAWYEHYHVHLTYFGKDGKRGGGTMLTFATSRMLRPLLQPVSKRRIAV